MNNVQTEILSSLPSSLGGFETFLEEPFKVFSQPNILAEGTFQDLTQELDLFLSGLEKNQDRNGKLTTTFTECPTKRAVPFPTLRDFIRAFFGADFRAWFMRTHLPFFPGERVWWAQSGFSHATVALWNKTVGRIVPAAKYRPLRISVELSDLGPDAFIPPHTDSAWKRMALVFYCPPFPVSEEMRESWGTVFWQRKVDGRSMDSWATSHQTGENEERFRENYEVALTVPYEANRINGFIKSKNSWHSVARNELMVPRRAVVINVVEIGLST